MSTIQTEGGKNFHLEIEYNLIGQLQIKDMG